ncbi:hypothetical protein EJV46_01540 [Roseococcus sp. SYP-B2431]|uniref:hypothetical protein n=1 Tax=Roseococcus sp. SYP-B2431 TaxID=2496640 RepID=UPI00103BABD2|nr:hypothetical protein [Roseococcus sp. SYP-B2431]TCH99389.1 hypothetical protein EJV46_01540 [Roseococcus sp. SYP-B2431]
MPQLLLAVIAAVVVSTGADAATIGHGLRFVGAAQPSSPQRPDPASATGRPATQLQAEAAR